MVESVAGLFDTTGFVPRRECGEWTPALMWLHVGGDLFIWLAYLSIPLVLLYFTRRRDLPYPGLFVLFALFIVACGTTHLIEALMFQYPLYRLSAAAKVATAAVSWATVAALVPVVPRVMAAVNEYQAGRSGPATGLGDTTLHQLAAPTARGRAADYIVAILAGVLALLVRAAVDGMTDGDNLFVLPLLAVVFVSWHGGFGPAVVTLCLTMTGVVYFFVAPRESLVVDDFGNQMATALFFFCGVCCAALGEAQRVARRGTKAALAAALEQKDELAAEVARRRAAEGSLQASEARLRAFYDHSPVCMGVVEPLAGDIRHVYDNPATCRFFGVDPDRTAGRRATELGTPPEILGLWLGKYRESAARGGAAHFEYEFDTPGGRRWLSATVSPLPPDPGGRRLFCYVAEDVTDRRRADQELRRVNALLTAVNEGTPTLVFVKDLDARMTYANPAACAALGRPLDRVLGADPVDLLGEDGGRPLLENDRRVLETGRTEVFEEQVRLPDGSDRVYLSTKTPARDPDGRVTGLIGVSTDVTDRTRARKALEESEERLRLAVDIAQMGTFEIDLDTDAVRVNDQGAAIYGWADTRTTFSRVREQFHPDDRPEVLRRVEAAFDPAGPGTFEVEQRIVRTDGGERWIRVRGRAFFDAPGRRATRCLGSYLDVTDRRRTEEGLREATRRVGAILDSITDAAFGLDAEFRYTYANRHWEAMFGRPAAGVVGRQLWDVFPGLVGTPVEDGYRRAMRDRVPVTVELVHPATGRWVEFRAYPAPDGGLGVYLRDIEDRKRAERERRQLLSLIETSTDLIGLAALDGPVTYFNDAGLRLLGLDSLDEARGKTLFDFVCPEDLPRLKAEMLPALERDGRWEGEWRYRNAKTGASVPVSKKVALIRDPGTGEPTAFATVSRDISDRLRAEAEVRESEARFRATADSAPALIWVGGPDGARTFFNRTWLEFTGRTAEQEAGYGWVEDVHPDDRDRYLAEYAAAAAGPRPFEIEYRLRRRDGEYRWVLARGTPRFAPDGGGAFAGLIGLCLDVTDRKAAVEQLRDEVRITEALNRIGTTLAGELDLDRVVQAVTDEATRLTEAKFGAFFYNAAGEGGESYTLYALSGVPREAFAGFPMPRNTAVFGPTFRGEGVVRLDDVTADPRYGRNPPHRGLPEGHLPVRSYLAVPVASRSGEVIGGLFFGHDRAGAFTARHEQLVLGVAAQAAIAIDNARLVEELRASEARFRQMADAAPVMIWVTEADGRCSYLNQQWYDLTGQAEETGLGYGWLDAVHPDDRAAAATAFRRSAERREPFRLEYRLRRADGAYRWCIDTGTPRLGGGGFIGSVLDITDRREVEEAVRRSEERFRTLTEAIPQIVLNADPAGAVTYVNRRWTDYTGEPLDRARGGGWLDAVHPDDRDRVAAAWRDTVGTAADGTADRFVHELRLRNAVTAEYRWFVTVAVPLRRADGVVDQWIGAMADIHDQKTAARRVEEANHFLEATIDALPSHIAVLDARGVILRVNAAWRNFGAVNGLRVRGYGVGANYLDACEVPCPSEPHTRLADGVRAVMAGDRPTYRVEYPCHSPAERRWFQMRVNRFPGGGPTRVVVSHEDITARVLAEEAVRESEEKFRTMAEGIPQLAWMARPDGHIFWYNRRWYEYTGTTAEDMQGWGWQKVHDPDVLPAVLERWRASLESGEPFDMVFPLKGADGRFRPFLTRVLPSRDGSGKIVLWFGTNTDVTEQREMEQALRDAAERFRTLTEAVPQMVWTADPGGEVTFFNRRWDEYTGVPLEKGRAGEWGGVVHPDDADQLRAEWQLAVARQPDRFTDEFRLRRAADGAYRWMLSTAVPLRDAAGGVAEWVGSITDIDDQKRYAEVLEHTVRERTAALEQANAALAGEVEERRAAEEQVRAVAAELARSNGELEQFAYVASHDLQEPLRKIQAFGDRLTTKFRAALPEPGREYVDRMQVSAGRMRRLIDDLLTYSRVTTQARPFARVNLAKLVREVVSDLSERVESSGADVRVGDLPEIDADPTQMRQLFQNLIANAIKFQKPGVRPVVEIRSELATAPLPRPDSDPVPVCRVTVRDNGIGFDEKYTDRIFQVFQRLHGRDEYEGTGVGLAICRKITERHGGAISARSRVGEGAAFVVTLPLRHPSPPAPPP